MAFSDHCKKYPGFVITNKEFAKYLLPTTVSNREKGIQNEPA